MIISRISKDTGLDIEFINKLVNSADHRYKIYYIDKRSKKSHDKRRIAHPSIELKFLQKWIVDNVFDLIPVHESVFSYRKGKSIQTLANLHRRKKYLLRIDFKDFFPSIKGRDIIQFLSNTAESINPALSYNDLKIIKSIVCMNNVLTIGSPSSPAISNMILFDFDKNCYEDLKEKGAIYSRYADDIYISTNKSGILKDIYTDIKRKIKYMNFPKLYINEEKTVFSSKKNRRIVTGLVLTSDNKISIGRNKKRFIKSLVYRYINGDLDDYELSYLRGYLAYVKSVEPKFLNRLVEKYSKNTILKIQKAKIVNRKERN